MKRNDARNFILVTIALICLSSDGIGGETSSDAGVGQVYRIAPGANVHFELQERLITAVPGDVIELAEGRFELKRQLDVVADGITIRGQGSDKTLLSFKGQIAGGQGIQATGDNFVIEGLAVEDTAGNAIKVLGSKNVTFRDVRTEWTGPAKSSNGAYGIYPVQCSNVLIEDCKAIGASDAGLYVGQCKDVVVRNCLAERNVAGIEIENTLKADVYDNVATNNAGGILVFDLPGLPVKAGGQVRVFRNKVHHNNHVNFAALGNMVAGVPSGTGVMVLATDDVEVFENLIHANQTGNVSIVSFLVMGKKISDPTFDPIPTRISIRDNEISEGGGNPQGDIAKLLRPIFGEGFTDIMFDGVPVPGEKSYEILIKNNGDATFANFKLMDLNEENIKAGKYAVDINLRNYQAKLKPLAPVKLVPHDAPSENSSRAVAVYKAAPRKLSEFGLFEGSLAAHEPADGVVRYDLNTALFSDYTSKYRFIKIPEGEKIEYREEGALHFPVGTVIAKTFSYPHDMRNPDAGQTHLETRIEQRLEDGWYGFSYQWNQDQTDAELVIGGAAIDVAWTHIDGTRKELNYAIPNANQCLTCHEQNGSFEPLGPKSRNLDRDFVSAHQKQNQLEFLAQAHLLVGLPDKNKREATPVSTDETVGIDRRARAWLDVNCAHCHNPGGTARTSGLDLSYHQTELGKIGVWKTPVAAGHGSGGRDYDIVPGKPDESILVHRLESTDPSVQMPNLARQMIPKDAVALIRDWIANMPEQTK